MELEEFVGLWSGVSPLRHAWKDRDQDELIIAELRLVYADLTKLGLAKELDVSHATAIINAYTLGRITGYTFGTLNGLGSQPKLW